MSYYSIHTHTEFSYKDGLSTPLEVATKNKEFGNDAFFITDHGNLNNWIKAYKAADVTGLQFIPGCEIYLVPDKEFWSYDKRNREKNGESISPLAVRYHHLTLVAKNQEGLQSLINIYNKHRVIYGKECIAQKTLYRNHEGLIVLSGCVAGEAIFYLQNDMPDKARESMKRMKDTWGDDFYCEVQWHGLKNTKKPEAEIYKELIEIARELDVKLVPTTDSHYTNADEAKWHALYKTIHYKKKDQKKTSDYKPKEEIKKDTDAAQSSEASEAFDGDGYHIMNEEEIRERMRNIESLTEEDIDQMIANTEVIRQKCEPTSFPKPIPLKDDSKRLRELVEEGFNRIRKGTDLEEESRERVEFELSTIERMSFTEYFVNVYAIINRAAELGIKIGVGRGSAAGSEIVYLLGITHVDPLKNGLMFERFLNPARSSYPDIDLDIQSEKDGRLGKDVLIESLSTGEDAIFPFAGQILNEVRATHTVLFKQLGTAFDIPYYEVNKVTTDADSESKYLLEDEYTGWLPGQLQRLGITFSDNWKMLEDNIEFIYKYGGVPGGDDVDGILWNTAVHASGVIFYPISGNILPRGKGVIPYRGHDLEDMGFIKYDLLSLDALNIINEFIPRIESDTGEEFEWENCNDPATWDTIQRADTDFVFQFSSPGMKRLLRTVKPDNVNTLAELNALYRPGALNAGIVDRYIANDFSDDEIVVGKFLKGEFGEDHSIAMIFQEDILKIVEKMGRFSLTDADLVRRSMQRKDMEKLSSYRDQFLTSFDTEKYGDIAESVWDKVVEFAAYTFNKSHALAYGVTAYWQAYIFTHYQNEMLVRLMYTKHRNEALQYLSKDRKLIFPSLSTKNTEYIIKETKVYLPTHIENPEEETFGHFMLNLDASKKRMIVDYGMLDKFCVDRKNLRDFGAALPLKKIETLGSVAVSVIEEAEDLKSFLEALSAVNIIDFTFENSVYDITVYKPKSQARIQISTRLNADILAHNAKKDVCAYGLVRSKYASSLPDIPFEQIVERLEKHDYDAEKYDKRYMLSKLVESHPQIKRIRNEIFDVVCAESKVSSDRAFGTFVFNDGVDKMDIRQRARGFVKSAGKNSPMSVRITPRFYIDKSGEVACRLQVVDAFARQV